MWSKVLTAVITFSLSHNTRSSANLFKSDGFINEPYQRYSYRHTPSNHQNNENRQWLGTEAFYPAQSRANIFTTQPSRFVTKYIFNMLPENWKMLQVTHLCSIFENLKPIIAFKDWIVMQPQHFQSALTFNMKSLSV